MLISNTLPQVTASQATNVAATQSALLSAAAASAVRPLTPAAVNAAAAASPYSPQLPQQRRVVTEQPSQPTAKQGYPAILPDPEFWRVPDRQVQAMPQPMLRTPAETVQQTAVYVAQVAAQATPELKEPASQQPTPAVSRKAAALIGKKPGVGDASGVSAYTVASQRNTSISLPSTVEAFA